MSRVAGTLMWSAVATVAAGASIGAACQVALFVGRHLVIGWQS